MEEGLTHTHSGCTGASSGREGGGLLQPWSQPGPRACGLLAQRDPRSAAGTSSPRVILASGVSVQGGRLGVFPSSSAHPPPARLGNRHRKWPHQALERQRIWGGNSWGHKRGRRGGGGPSSGAQSPSSRPRSQLPSRGGAVGSPCPQGPSGPGAEWAERLSQQEGLVRLSSPFGALPAPRGHQGVKTHAPAGHRGPGHPPAHPPPRRPPLSPQVRTALARGAPPRPPQVLTEAAVSPSASCQLSVCLLVCL